MQWTVDVTLLAGTRSSYVRLRTAQKRITYKFTDAVFDALYKVPEVIDAAYDSEGSEFIHLRHQEGIDFSALIQAFEAAGARTGTIVTVQTV